MEKAVEFKGFDVWPQGEEQLWRETMRDLERTGNGVHYTGSTNGGFAVFHIPEGKTAKDVMTHVKTYFPHAKETRILDWNPKTRFFE